MARAWLVERPLRLMYMLVAMSLWHAPIYAWLLVVSGGARRAAFVWAVLPLVAAFLFEKITVRHTSRASRPTASSGGKASRQCGCRARRM